MTFCAEYYISRKATLLGLFNARMTSKSVLVVTRLWCVDWQFVQATLPAVGRSGTFWVIEKWFFHTLTSGW
jgi:hypothetical protein